MTRTMWVWTTLLTVLGAVDLGVAIHSRVTWVRPAGGPSAMNLGQALGFISSTVLFIAAGLIVIGGIKARRARKQRFRP